LHILANGEIVGIPDLVRSITAATGIAKISGQACRKCLATLRAGYAADLPSTNDSVGDTA